MNSKTQSNKLFSNSALKSKLINNNNIIKTNPTTKLSSTSAVSFNQKLTNTATTTPKSNSSYVSNRFLQPSVLINNDKYVNKSYRAERLLRASNKSPVFKKSVSTLTGSSLVSNQNRSYFSSTTNLNESKLAVSEKFNYFYIKPKY